MKKVRLYCPDNLFENKIVKFDKSQTHYLLDVLRLHVGDNIFLFNNGIEFKCEIISVNKNDSLIKVCEISDKENKTLPICLAVALIRPNHFEWLIEKATELGVKKIQPLITEFVNQPKMKVDRFEKIIVEASEQCGRNDIPVLAEPVKLCDFLSQYKYPVYYADERRLNENSEEILNGECAIVIGPEGGFSESEFEMFKKYKSIPLNLGRLILRTETAVIVAISKLMKD